MKCNNIGLKKNHSMCFSHFTMPLGTPASHGLGIPGIRRSVLPNRNQELREYATKIKTHLPGLPEMRVNLLKSALSSRLVACSTLYFVIYHDGEVMGNIEMLMSCRQSSKVVIFSQLFLRNRTTNVCSQSRCPTEILGVGFTAESVR